MSYFSFNGNNRVVTNSAGAQQPGARADGNAAAAAAAAAAPMSIGVWDNDALDNDDFDSDQLDEDESYSWASGITDHQDGSNGNGANSAGSNVNWRDWRAAAATSSQQRRRDAVRTVNAPTPKIPKLVDLCAQYIAASVPFELVESFRDPVPEELQLKITYASFPQSIDNVRLYSCLANGCADEYVRGEQLFNGKCVKKCIQIGFHLSAQVMLPAPNPGAAAATSNSSHHHHNALALNLNTPHQSHNIGISLLHQHNMASRTAAPAAVATQTTGAYTNVAVICDRKRIISCSCTCSKQALPWCSHIVAVCLHRILEPEQVEFRAPVSESLSKLHREQLQKFAQYLISELPTQILPTAQKLLDELLKDTESSINVLSGAPDPTAGASQDDVSVWCLDDLVLKENIHRTLQKSIIPVPNIVCDLEGLDQNSSATAIEFTNLLKPLRGHEPEGMWNLISIVREMFRRNDKNSIPILRMITHECLGIEQIVHLWFLVKSSQLYYDKTLFNLVTLPSSMSGLHRNGNAAAATAVNSNSNNNAQTLPVHQACACLMDEIVMAWRLACLNPAFHAEVALYREQLLAWQSAVFESIRKYCTAILNNANSVTRSSPNGGSVQSNAVSACEKHLRRLDMDIFSGFLPAIFASRLTWSEFNLDNYGEFEARLGALLPRQAVKPEPPTTPPPQPPKLEEALAAVTLKDAEPEVTAKPPVASPTETNDDELFNLYSFEYDPLKMIKPASGGAAKVTKASGITDELARLRVQFIETATPYAEHSFDMLFARCEALFAHGFNEHACLLAKLLAEYLLRTAARAKSKLELASLSNTTTPPAAKTASLKAAALRQKFVCNFYTTVLYRASVLAHILLETSLSLPASFEANYVRIEGLLDDGDTESVAAADYYPRSLSQLAFRMGIFGLEVPRMPAISKALEVRLINQEQELVSLVKRMPVSKYELSLMRDRAAKLSQLDKSSPPPVNASFSLPIMLASLIFDVLFTHGGGGGASEDVATSPKLDDQQLAFEAALNVLALKCNINESQHSLLCEGIRRQKGDLTLNLLLTYKDDEQRLLKIVERILDRDTHVLFKPAASVIMLNPFNPNFKKIQHQQLSQFMAQTPDSATGQPPPVPAEPAQVQQPPPPVVERKPAAVVNKNSLFKSAIDSLSSGWEESENESPNLSSSVSLLETKHRCLNQQKQHQHLFGGGGGGQQTSSRTAADATTTSSDNSPTVTRKAPPVPAAAVTAGSSDTAKKASTIDDSDDSVGESSSSSRGSLSKKNSTDSSSNPEQVKAEPPPPPEVPEVKVTSTKAAPRVTAGLSTAATRPLNQPSGALAHFLLEFSRTVLSKAGGSASTVVFQNHPGNGPHRNLHICSFLIALYGLGIHNCLHSNWMQRNYSSAVSWITSQAVDIGFPAICILIECWQGRLTPSECVSLADKVSRGRDSMAVKAAAELALSSLSQANLMNSSEIQRALIQCKEQNNEMLQRACITVEHALKDGTSSITLEVLFSLARRWEELFNETVRANSSNNNTAAATAAVTAMNMPAFGPPAGINPTDLIYYNQNAALNLNANLMLNKAPLLYANIAQHAPFLSSAAITTTVPSNFQGQQQFGGGVNVNVNVNMGINAANTAANFNSLVKNLPVTVLSSNLPGATVGPPSQQQSAFMAAPNVFMPPHYSAQQSQQQQQQQQQFLNYNPPNLVNIQANYHQQQQQRYQMQNYLMQQYQQQMSNAQQQASSLSNLEPLDSVSLKHLTSAFRVGLLGLEALPKRHETPGMIRWRQNTPPYAEDVKWLGSVAIKLDTYLKNNNYYLQQFCQAAALSITNPCLMQDIAIESARYLCRTNSIVMQKALCSTTLNILTQKCMNTHYRCFTSGKQNHPVNSDEFINALFHAQEIFMLAENMNQFMNMIDAIKRARKREKDLIQKLDSKMSKHYMNMSNNHSWMSSGQ